MRVMRGVPYRLKGNLFQSYGAVIALLVLLIINCFTTKNFISITTVWNLIMQSTTVAILALGMTTVIATGGIDISVGSVMALSAMVAAKNIYEGRIVLGIVAGILVAVASGVITGLVVTKFKVQPMITSLAMMYVLRGVAKLLNGGVVMNYKNATFSNLAYIRLWGQVPIQLPILLVVTMVMYLLLRKTRFGVYVESYGDNPVAARTAGINTVLVVVSCYVVCAVLASLSGMLEAAMVTSVDPALMGSTKEMDAIAATAVGGTSMSGGKPNVWGTLCGALTLQLITMMVNMNNIPYSYSLILKTLIIIVAVYSQRVSGARN